MDNANTKLLSTVRVGPYTLANRMVMAPLTRNRADPDSFEATPLMAEYYAQRAGAGLIISEASQISRQGIGYPATPGIYNAAQVAAWQGVTLAVHGSGGRIFLQLWHVGRISHPSLQVGGALPVAPSALRPAGFASTYAGPQEFVTPRALLAKEIPGIVADYRNAAQNALAAGFDGVEIHAANGYLLDQFLRDGTNLRDDAYGGNLENRARLLLEVVTAVCAVCGDGQVGVRLSPLQPFNDMRDSDPQTTFSFVADALNRFPLAYLHVTEMGKEAPGAAGPSFDLRRLREIYRGTYITNGGYDQARAEAAIAAGDADLVAFGVPFIANPDLPRRFALGAPLNAADPGSFYGGGAHGYTDYPLLSEP